MVYTLPEIVYTLRPYLVAARSALQERSEVGSVCVAVRYSEVTVSTDATSFRCGHIQSVAQTACCRARCHRVPAGRATRCFMT